MTKFNALDDGWIPVRFVSGEVREVGIAEALLKAQDIESLTDANPLGPTTQIRLLVALIQSVFQPEDHADWRDLWNQGAFEAAALNNYFKKHWDRFDLFHPKMPFLQVGGDFKTDKTISVNDLSIDTENVGYNDHFSHFDPEPSASPSEALRKLLLSHCFSIGLGKSQQPFWNSGIFKRPYYSNAPFATSAIIVVEGANLFQSILLNLVPDSRNSKPCWETGDKAYFDSEVPTGHPDALTNQSRMIRLLPQRDSADSIIINQCYYTQGKRLEGTPIDSMVSYTISKEEGITPVRISVSKATWRSLHAILAWRIQTQSHIRALNLRNVAYQIDSGVLSRNDISIRVSGIATQIKQARKVLLWRTDEFRVPANFFVNDDLIAVLESNGAIADKIAAEIGSRVHSMCQHYLAPVKDQKSTDQKSTDQKKDVSALANQLDARTGYWATLENQFPELLSRISNLADTQPESIASVTEWWTEICHRAAGESVATSQNRLGKTARAWRAIASISPYFGKPTNRNVEDTEESFE